MTEESPPGIGTVAQEAARLIEDMATMARSGYSGSNDSSGYAGEPAQEPVPPYAPPEADASGRQGSADDEPDVESEGYDATDNPTGRSEATGDGREVPCSMCGGEGDNALRDDTPSTCKICPLCRGIALLRSVRPETVDMLADLALSVAAGLRDVATRSRASDSSARSSSYGSPDPGRDPVQDIPVDDESEGPR